MNLIRLIKLKKINGDLENLTDHEKYFLSFFDSLKTVYGNRYTQNDILFFYLDKENKILYYSYLYVYLNFKHKYNTNNLNFNKLIIDILETKLNLDGFATMSFKFDDEFKL